MRGSGFLQNALGGGNLLGVGQRDRLAQGLGEGFKEGFEDVVLVRPVTQIQVQGKLAAPRDGLEEIVAQFGVEFADLGSGDGDVVNEVPTPAQIEGGVDQGLLHRHGDGPVAGDPLAVAERGQQEFPEHDADVLDGVVVVDFEVAFGRKGEADPAVLGQMIQHVVEKTDSGPAVASPFAIQDDLGGDIGFLGFPVSLSASGFHGLIVGRKGNEEKRPGTFWPS